MNMFEEFENENEKPLDRLVNDGGYASVFRKIGFVGDSLSSGEFEVWDSNKEKRYLDMFEYSWGQHIARMCGSKGVNFSRGGMTAKEYCESFAELNRYWDSANACQCYCVALGVNDLFGLGQEVGSAEDIDKDDWHNNKQTFAGYYAQIIMRLKKIQPRAKFFLMTMPNEESDDERLTGLKKAHRELLYKFAELFDNTYVLDFYQYAPVYDEKFKKRFYLGGHLNPMGYRLTAVMTVSYIDYIIRHNMEDFREIALIGTDLHG